MRSIDVSLARLDNRIDELTQIAPEQPSIGSINPDNLPSHIAVTDEPQAIELGFRIVTQDNQNVADGTVVRFEAFDGQIDPVTTTRDGMAYTRFRPTSNSGDVMIVVGVGGVESAFSIALTPPPTLDRIELDPDRTRLRADGRDTAQIIIRAIDNHGNPMENVAITLRVEPAGSGSLSANEITIAGEGTVSFTAGAQEGHPTIIAEAQDGSGINSRLELELVNNMTELTVTPSETEFWNSGDDEVRLGIILKDGLGNSMPDRLVTLEITGAAEAWFLGDDEQPILDSFVTTRNTDENGATEAWCRLGETPGEVVIVVRAEEQEERVTLTIGELGPSVVEIQADPTELLIDEQSNLSITVRDQRGTPVPDISVTLTMEPAGMGEIASELVTGEDGSAPVIFTARSAGQTTIAVAMNESISESIILTIIEGGDEDGDGRSDSRERELGTDPAIADDKVAIEGPLGGTWALRPIFHVPAGVVLDRVDRNSPQDSQTVRLQVWVKMDDLNWIGDEQRTLKEGARISLAQEGFDQLLLGVGLVIEGYTVRIVEGQVRDDWQLAEIEGYFPIENLDRP
ncbi:MAG: hypothetical protein GY832_17095 [Chloroflexi bacterium]|nr:hypothetical protein [Chloroflexota bacterium]